jgi:hypothetical protein
MSRVSFENLATPTEKAICSERGGEWFAEQKNTAKRDRLTARQSEQAGWALTRNQVFCSGPRRCRLLRISQPNSCLKRLGPGQGGGSVRRVAGMIRTVSASNFINKCAVDLECALSNQHGEVRVQKKTVGGTIRRANGRIARRRSPALADTLVSYNARSGDYPASAPILCGRK